MSWRDRHQELIEQFADQEEEADNETTASDRPTTRVAPLSTNWRELFR